MQKSNEIDKKNITKLSSLQCTVGLLVTVCELKEEEKLSFGAQFFCCCDIPTPSGGRLFHLILHHNSLPMKLWKLHGEKYTCLNEYQWPNARYTIFEIEQGVDKEMHILFDLWVKSDQKFCSRNCVCENPSDSF